MSLFWLYCLNNYAKVHRCIIVWHQLIQFMLIIHRNARNLIMKQELKLFEKHYYNYRFAMNAALTLTKWALQENVQWLLLLRCFRWWLGPFQTYNDISHYRYFLYILSLGKHEIPALRMCFVLSKQIYIWMNVWKSVCVFVLKCRCTSPSVGGYTCFIFLKK